MYSSLSSKTMRAALSNYDSAPSTDLIARFTRLEQRVARLSFNSACDDLLDPTPPLRQRIRSELSLIAMEQEVIKVILTGRATESYIESDNPEAFIILASEES